MTKVKDIVWCPKCQFDIDQKMKPHYEGSYRQYVVYVCPNCDLELTYNRQRDEY